MLREIDTNLWVAEQPLKYLGLNVGTRMTVIRLENGKIVLISPVEMNEILLAQLNTIGRVSYIIAPNLSHYLFAAKCKSIYPQAEFWAAAGLEVKQPKLKIDRLMGDRQGTMFEELDYLLFEGFRTFGLTGASPLNEYVFFHRQSQTLILTDTAFHFDESFPSITRFLAQTIGSYNKLRPSWLEKLATRATEKVKQSVRQVLEWNFQRVIVAHGSLVSTDAKQKFKEGYEWFLECNL
ncbi:MAG TPA: DUF4336 domain-containing protein [Oscillatoriales cyanobacterium M59_W2019_021]|nr:MAG: DUF4336 domain-containing protein [Cyanobacteria bacterium J055]HIK32945.1 DUF4336 domain-containing protein [Oscillatoriales cyanobacterium M4454_W2019_049]HIK52589.1 DUF4336 domain-containing protein [Oscillatoriales cyanobacterium M59_W2019_021]